MLNMLPKLSLKILIKISHFSFFLPGTPSIQGGRQKRFGIQQQPISNSEYKEFNIDTSKLYNELYTAIKKDKLSTKNSVRKLQPNHAKIEAAEKRASLKASPSIANFYTAHKAGVVKPKIKAMPISRQQIEYGTAGRSNYNAYWNAQTPSQQQQQTLNARAETTSPLVSEPLPISTVVAQQKQNSAYGEYLTPSATAASSDLNFLSNNVDPFDSSSLKQNQEYSTAEQAAAVALKSATHGISSEKPLQRQAANGKSSMKQQHPSVKINLPTPQPFHHSQPLVQPAHKTPSQLLQDSKTTIEGQEEQNTRPSSKTLSTDDKGASKRVYSLGDHGK